MNAIHILGRIVNDPEFRMTQSGVPMCNFRVAVPKKYPKPTDKEKSNFFNVIAWRQTAEFINKYFSKGKRIIVHGELNNDNYNDTNGVTHYNNVIIAENVEFVDTKANSEQNEYSSYSNNTVENFAIPNDEDIINDGDVPF